MGFDFHLAGLAGGPVAIAAPRPIVGLFNEAAHDGIAMDVLELFDELGVGEDVEVVVAALPELRTSALESLRSLVFEYVQGDGERVEFGLADEKMDVLGHEDVSEDIELMAAAKLLEFSEEG
jgi:hypothetical protein